MIFCSIVLAPAAGCSDDTEPSSATEAATLLGFDPSTLPDVREMANVALTGLPVGTVCSSPELEPRSDSSGPAAIVFGCEAANDELSPDDASDVSYPFEKIAVLDFGSEAESTDAFGPGLITQSGRKTMDSRPSTEVPDGTICVRSTESGDDPYQRCGFRVGRFVVTALGNESEPTGAEIGLRTAVKWLRAVAAESGEPAPGG
ncbi:MAG: hypothetical protein WAP35_03590 [Solirubrobacterales bacterium]